MPLACADQLTPTLHPASTLLNHRCLRPFHAQRAPRPRSIARRFSRRVRLLRHEPGRGRRGRKTLHPGLHLRRQLSPFPTT